MPPHPWTPQDQADRAGRASVDEHLARLHDAGIGDRRIGRREADDVKVGDQHHRPTGRDHQTVRVGLLRDTGLTREQECQPKKQPEPLQLYLMCAGCMCHLSFRLIPVVDRLTNFFVTALSGPNGLDGVGSWWFWRRLDRHPRDPPLHDDGWLGGRAHQLRAANSFSLRR